MSSSDPTFTHNYALYLAAGYRNDLDAVRHALIQGKILQISNTNEKGYILVNENIWPKSYEKDWRPYKHCAIDGFAASHQAALRGFKEVLEILFTYGQFSAFAKDGRDSKPNDYAYEGGHDALATWILQTGKIQKQTRKINKFIRNTIKRKDITLQDYLLEIGYIRKHKSGKIIIGDSLIAIHKIWRDKLKKKVKDLLINEKEFVVIIEKISIAVDGLKLELPLSEDALKRIRRKKRARN